MNPLRALVGALLHHPWRLFFWLWHASGARGFTSRVARSIFERRFRTLPPPLPLPVLEGWLGELHWRPDLLGGALDLASRPERVYELIQSARSFAANHWQDFLDGREGSEGPARSAALDFYWSTVRRLDCEDFAVFAAAALGPAYLPVLISVNWWDREGRMHGHAVCCFRAHGPPPALAHISNFDGGRARLGFSTLADVVADLVRDGRLVGWAVLDPTTLRTLAVHV